MFQVHGIDAIPFWSSRGRVEKIQKTFPKYARYTIHEEEFSMIYNDTLPWLEGERVHVGVNWSGERLSGYDLSVEELRKNLSYRMEKKSTTPRKVPNP